MKALDPPKNWKPDSAAGLGPLPPKTEAYRTAARRWTGRRWPRRSRRWHVPAASGDMCRCGLRRRRPRPPRRVDTAARPPRPSLRRQPRPHRGCKPAPAPAAPPPSNYKARAADGAHHRANSIPITSARTAPPSSWGGAGVRRRLREDRKSALHPPRFPAQHAPCTRSWPRAMPMPPEPSDTMMPWCTSYSAPKQSGPHRRHRYAGGAGASPRGDGQGSQSGANDAHLDDTVSADVAAGQQVQLNQTPTMIVTYKGKSQLLAPVPQYDLLKSYLDELLASSACDRLCPGERDQCRAQQPSQPEGLCSNWPESRSTGSALGIRGAQTVAGGGLALRRKDARWMDSDREQRYVTAAGVYYRSGRLCRQTCKRVGRVSVFLRGRLQDAVKTDLAAYSHRARMPRP